MVGILKPHIEPSFFRVKWLEPIGGVIWTQQAPKHPTQNWKLPHPYSVTLL